MATSYRWSAEEEHLLRLLRPTNTYSEMAEEFTKRAEKGLYGFKAERTSEAIRKKCVRDGITSSDSGQVVDQITERWEQIEDIQRMYAEDAETRTIGRLPPEDITTKILSLSDIHFPLARTDMLKEAVETHFDSDIVVLNGDILEGYVFSTFEKDKRISALHEYNMAFEFVRILREKFPQVVLVEGNHDYRSSRAVKAAGFEQEASQVLRPNLLARIANGERLDSTGMLIEKHDFDNVTFQQRESWYVKIGKTLFIHPSTRGNGKPGWTVQQWDQKFKERYQRNEYDSIVCGHCFDEETEILTQDGWKGIDSISKTDTVGTLNTESNTFEWNPIDAVWKYENDKELIYFGQDGCLQVAVTPEHGMLWRSQPDITNGYPWRKNKALEIEHRAQIAIPTSAIEQQKTDYPITDDELKLLAWIVTEGSIDTSKGRSPAIRLHQSDDHNNYVHEIDKLLSNLNIKNTKRLRYRADTIEHGVYRNFDAYRWYLSVSDSKWVFQFITNDKNFKDDLLLSLSQRQRLLLIDELCKGDGSKCGQDTWQAYYTKDVKLRDQVQMLLTISGFTSNSKLRKDGTYYISFTENQQKYLSKIDRRPYSGRTFCLTVPNGTLVARRRGWVFITQNTHQVYKGVLNSTLLIEQGCLAGFLGYAWKPQSLHRYNGQNGYAVIYQDKDGNTDFNLSGPIYLGEMLPPKKSAI